ncbi:MAG TPA: hypothetical protein EYQ66_04820 [Myxococcales bacterium]|nr:hypothetical protein [Myxococcales bacterium]
MLEDHRARLAGRLGADCGSHARFGRPGGMSLELAVFYFFGALGVAAASFLLVEGRTPISSSMAFCALGLAIAGVLQTLDADFLAVAQWILSLSAGLVLLVSSVMVAGVATESLDLASPARVLGKLAGGVAVAGLVGLLLGTMGDGVERSGPIALTPGTADLGQALFGAGAPLVFVLGLLLLVALVGGVILAKRRLD